MDVMKRPSEDKVAGLANVAYDGVRIGVCGEEDAKWRGGVLGAGEEELEKGGNGFNVLRCALFQSIDDNIDRRMRA